MTPAGTATPDWGRPRPRSSFDRSRASPEMVRLAGDTTREGMVKRGCGCRYGRPRRGRQRSASTSRSCGPAAEAPRGAPRDLVTHYVPITCARQGFKPTYFTKSTPRFWAWLAIFRLHLGRCPPSRPSASTTPHETFICVVLIGTARSAVKAASIGRDPCLCHAHRRHSRTNGGNSAAPLLPIPDLGRSSAATIFEPVRSQAVQAGCEQAGGTDERFFEPGSRRDASTTDESRQEENPAGSRVRLSLDNRSDRRMCFAVHHRLLLPVDPESCRIDSYS
jgi:hypothetical protein